MSSSEFAKHAPRRRVRRRGVLQAAAGLLPLPMWAALATSPTGQVMRVGILGATTAAGFGSQWEAFRLGLRELGWVAGRDLVYEVRFADDQPERLPSLAAELVALPGQLRAAVLSNSRNAACSDAISTCPTRCSTTRCSRRTRRGARRPWATRSSPRQEG